MPSISLAEIEGMKKMAARMALEEIKTKLDPENVGFVSIDEADAMKVIDEAIEKTRPPKFPKEKK